jgi:hypothetical protein
MERHIISIKELEGLVYEKVLASSSGNGMSKSLVMSTAVQGSTQYIVKRDGAQVKWTSILSVAIEAYNILP